MDDREPVPDCSSLVEKILGLLEVAGVPEHVNDRIVRQIEAWEQGKDVCEHAILVGDWCEECHREYSEAQIDPENGNGETVSQEGQAG